MHQVQVEIEKTTVEAPPPAALKHQKKLLEEAGAEEKWLRRSLVLIRWGVRGILINAWASFLHHNFKRVASSWATLSVSAALALFSLLLYVCSLLYRRFARHALASVSLNRALALFNLSWALVLLLTALASRYLGQLVEEEDIYILSMFFYPHTNIANLFLHLFFTRPLATRQRLSPLEAKCLPPKRPACSTICCLVLQIFLLVLWILYPIARIHDSLDHYLKSPYVFSLFILSTIVATISFIVFFCSAIALVFYEHEEFPTLL